MTAPRRTLLVGTAGHIDHGKTSLVRALTGFDLDRTPEEQARGITIQLGFAWCDLPSGRVAFVDVPGHERLVRTMIAGAHGIDAALIVVSALEGVMPQTREHVAILGLLGVDRAVVALSQIDRCDPDLVELAEDDVRQALDGSPLAAAPIVRVSAVTGAGLDALRSALSVLEPRDRATAGPFRMSVDRAFVRAGFGTVVTGTVAAGEISDGATVWIHPGGRRARVRGLQVHGAPRERATTGERAALNLAGPDAEGVERGDQLTGETIAPTSILDVWYNHLPDAPPVEHEPSVRVLLGTTDVGARLAVATESGALGPGDSGPAQLRLEAPVIALPGDRFVVRLTSPARTLGGGVVVDPWAPRLRARRRPEHAEELLALYAGDTSVWLRRAGAGGLSRAEWDARAPHAPAAVLGERAFHPDERDAHRSALIDAARRAHVEQPLARGASRQSLRQGRLAALDDASFDALIDALVAEGSLRLDGALVADADFVVTLDPAAQRLSDAALARIEAAGLSGTTLKDLAKDHADPRLGAVVHLLEARGGVTQMAGVGFVPTHLLDALLGRLRAWFDASPEMSPTEFKELSGLSRSAAIPMLEWLDRQRYTRRRENQRIRGPALDGAGD
jgi:selenocysteine-specific elongation factor